MSTDLNEDDDELLEKEMSNTATAKINQSETFKNDSIRNLFQIESKNLNSDNEMIRMFGAKIVQSERQTNTHQRGGGIQAARNQPKFRINSIVNVKNTWPPFRRNGNLFLFGCKLKKFKIKYFFSKKVFQ